MTYKTIYEIAANPVAGIEQMLSSSANYPYMIVLISILFLIIAVSWTPLYEHIIRMQLEKWPSKLGDPYREPLKCRTDATIIALVTFSVFMLIFISNFSANRRLEAEYRAGKLKVVEGTVKDFSYSSGYRSRPAYVTFSLDNREIRYSANAAGFAQTNENVLKDGDRVRLWLIERDVVGFTSRIPVICWLATDRVSIGRVDVALSGKNSPQTTGSHSHN